MPVSTTYKEEPCSGLWRSQDMKLVSVTFERDKIKKDMLLIGRMGCVQFCDMNAAAQAFSKQYAGEVRRCEDVLRMLRFFKEQEGKWEPEIGWRVKEIGTEGAFHERALDETETEVKSITSEYHKTLENYQQLSSNWINTYEYWQLLDAAHVREVTGGSEESGLGLLAGTIPSSKLATFERLAYRCTRGYCKLHLSELPKPSIMETAIADAGEQFKDDDLDRYLFIGVFGSQSVGSRLKRLAQSMDARILLENNLSMEQRVNEEREQRQHIVDISKMLMKSRESLQSLLRTRILPNMSLWTHTAVIHKGIAHTMNLLHMRTHTAIGVAWVPSSKMESLQDALRSGVSRGDTVITVLETPSHVSPPTYFETNQYTEVFQGIVSSYGVPRYKEVNPGVFTIITFPWLFGVMYGDIGHGLIITFVAAMFILYEKRLMKQSLNELVEMIFSARYLLLFMGLFATFYGLLYNDAFGLMLEYSSSSFDMLVWQSGSGTISRPAQCKDGPCGICGAPETATMDSTTGYSAPSFGVDVAWSGASKKLDLYNSFKMKSAIVIGICQMMLGLVLQFCNNRYFGDWKHIYFGFIPEVIFLTCTFGYMSFLIILKWVSPFQTGCKVSLLETMVNFFLNPGGGPNFHELFAGQLGIQQTLLGFAAIAVMPFMLFPIPYIEWKYHSTHDYADNDSDRESTTLVPQEMQEMRAVGQAGGEDNNDLLQSLFPVPEYIFDMQEVCIKQIIHAIEFVLGSVSNTASYLRLWALSLAHAQLSEVFLEFLIMLPIEQPGQPTAFVFAGFTVWLTATLGVLVGMEALSAFLHALRLHWVEFQNKFYIADGTMFMPLDIKTLEEEANEIHGTEI